ncbi:MAG: peroxidase family protein, partial [Candidatus Solibacter sp.]
MRKRVLFITLLAAISCNSDKDKAIKAELESLRNCGQMVNSGIRPIAATRDQRFLGKVEASSAGCRGGELATQFRATPWVDWSNYWGTGDAQSKGPEFVKQAKHLGPTGRGIDGALLDLEYERIELVKFNLFDNNKTYKEFVTGRKGVGGPALKTWRELRLPPVHANYREVGGAGDQVCKGELIRGRTLSGICNDIKNPLMGSTGTPFARNAEFQELFPEMGRTELTRNRHGDRLALLKPDPQVISRKLFTRAQSNPGACNDGQGLPGFSKDANCDYKKAPFFNVLAAFWIQFMTHDWFSHLDEGHNAKEFMNVGCSDADQKLGCRPGDRIDKALVADASEPKKFTHDGKEYLERAPKTFANNVTAWWDASQIYGYSDVSRKRVKRDPADAARLLQPNGLLPGFEPNDPINPEWTGQEATAFPDNWSIGMSFYTNLFVREHNNFVAEFRRQAGQTPEADSGLRNPAKPDTAIRYKDVTPDELFEAARLVVAAEIAKIHTIEWTPQ